MTNTSISFEQRVQGALMGAYIGDALSVGPHWYYDLAAMHAAYGPWISHYTEPKPGRYHAGLKAGQSSQAGFILDLLVDSLAEQGHYDEPDFCRRLDETLFPLLDGSARKGPGNYTNQSIRETWALRVRGKRPWGQCAGFADTTESAERIMALAARYARAPGTLAQTVAANTALLQRDTTILAMTVAYGCVLGSLLRGEPLDAQTSDRLTALGRDGTLDFNAAVSSGGTAKPGASAADRPAGSFASPEALFAASGALHVLADPAIRIEPAWKIATVYGMPCAAYYQFPAAYYLAGRFQEDFESAVLHAINGGGENRARAMLTGTLSGAIGGIQSVPRRFIDDLERGHERLEKAARLALQAAA